MISTLIVRTRYPGEELPEELRTEFELCRIDPDWHWLVEYEDRVVAQILCANAHGMLIFLRISATKDSPKSCLVVAFRKVFQEARKRGCLGYLAMMEDKQPQEVKLMRICQKIGSTITPFYGAIVAGSLDLEY